VAMMDVRKELNFCKQTGIPVLGVVENMATMALPVAGLRFADKSGRDVSGAALQLLREKCPELLALDVTLSVFPAAGGGPRAMAQRFNVPFLGSLPLDPSLQNAGEQGRPLLDGNALQPLRDIVSNIVATEPVTSKLASEPHQQLASGVISA
jgi:hypothetical protein